MALKIVGVERFLNPDQIELFHASTKTHCRSAIPLLVRIDHDWNTFPQVFAEKLNTLKISNYIRLTNLYLHALNATGQRTFGTFQYLLNGGLEIPAG